MNGFDIYENDCEDLVFEQQRNDAIKILLKTKKIKAKKLNKKIINDIDILNVYNEKGIEGIKKMFNNIDCYLYETSFVYNILFHHYKKEWREIEKIIKRYD